MVLSDLNVFFLKKIKSQIGDTTKVVLAVGWGKRSRYMQEKYQVVPEKLALKSRASTWKLSNLQDCPNVPHPFHYPLPLHTCNMGLKI